MCRLANVGEQLVINALRAESGAEAAYRRIRRFDEGSRERGLASGRALFARFGRPHSYAASNLRRAIYRLDRANSVTSCAVSFANPW